MDKSRQFLARNGLLYRSYCRKIAREKPSPQNTEKTSTTSTKPLFGQPTHQTHPHLLQSAEEVTPCITKTEFRDRRHRLAALIKAQKPELKKHLVVIPSASKKYMSDKIPYVFRQDMDFLYLTGCQEPDSCLVVEVEASQDTPTSTLFVREKDEHAELWDGPRTGPQIAPQLFGVERSLPMQDLETFLDSHRKTSTASLWYDFHSPIQGDVHRVIGDFLSSASHKSWESPRSLIHNLRLIKSPAEISLMLKSCEIASKSISGAMGAGGAGVSEHQLFAHVDYECRMRGADFLAYPPVVAGGERATIIHYINNNQIIREGDLVLMDAGCEYHGYASDITRTWPINGKFSAPQRELYEAVLEAQKKLIEKCAKFPSLDDLFETMCTLLGEGLQKIGLLSRNLSGQGLLRGAHEFCPHHVSHYLGMDVHDTPSVTRRIPTRPGMIITVEPGVYIGHKLRNVPQEFRGLGIRIEDDVLLTESGPVVLTKTCPKEVEDVEKACNS